MLRQLKQTASRDTLTVRVESRWLHPSQSARKNVQCGIVIAVERESAVRAFVPAHRKFLGHHYTTPGADLTRTTRINLDNPSTSLLSFVREDSDEAGPSGVRDRTGEPVILEHVVHAQALHSDKPVPIGETVCDLQLVLAPQVTDATMYTTEPLDGLPSIGAAFGLARYRTSGATKGRQCGVQVARILDLLTFARSEEGFQSHVDADSGAGMLGNLHVAQVARHDQVPFARVLFEREGFDLALGRPVQLDADRADMLHSEPITIEPDAIAMRREEDRRVATTRLEPGIARSLAQLDTPEEVLVCGVEAAKRGLRATEIESRIVRIGRTLGLVARRLRGVANRGSSGFPRSLSLGESGVVQPTMRLQHRGQFALLVRRGPKPVHESTAHLSALLRLDVTSHGGFRDVPDRTSVVAPTPQRRQSRAERRKLLPQNARRVTLQPIDDLGDGARRIALDKEVDVIGHYLRREYLDVVGSSLLAEQYSKPRRDRRIQHGAAVLRAPHKVVLEREHGAGILGVSLHNSEYTPDLYLNQPYSTEGGVSAVA